MRRRDREAILFCVALLAITFVVFASACRFPLLHGWDDNVYVTNNTERLTLGCRNIAYWFAHPCVGCYLPLTMLSYMVDYALWELNPVGYHLQSILWHLLAVSAVYLGFLACKLSSRVAFVFALIFAVHPQRVESVVWISERKDVMCAALYFWSLLSYVRASGRRRFPWLALVLFVAAMLSKSMAISLPLVLVFYELHQSRSARLQPVVRRLWPFFLVAVAFVPVTVAAQTIPADQSTTLHQLIVPVHNVLWYVRKTLLPVRLSPVYPRVSFTPPLVTVLVLAYGLLGAFLAVSYRRRRDWLLFSVLPLVGSYVAALGPVSGLVPLGYIDAADRYSYIPSAFLWLGLALSVRSWLESRTGPLRGTAGSECAGLTSRRALAAMAVSGLYALVLLAMTLVYSRAWCDIRTLHHVAARHDPPNHFALGTLGDIELSLGNFDRVFEIADRVEALHGTWLTESTRVANQNKANSLRAFALHRCGRKAEALVLLERVWSNRDNTALRVRTNYGELVAVLADCYAATGNRARTLECYDDLVRWYPSGSYQAHFYGGVRAHYAGDYRRALEQFREADRVNPGERQIQANILDCEARLRQAEGEAGETPVP